ncbi:hypothetical protein A2W24_04530 [Microgenomates group bacterium RBG_16_45_19]|nr:MAG: hypothetical protein A2W24_04530 [Microgenomates group bacterium RBG_16_45_19]
MRQKESQNHWIEIGVGLSLLLGLDLIIKQWLMEQSLVSWNRGGFLGWVPSWWWLPLGMVVIAGVGLKLKQTQNRWLKWSWLLILAGGIGNLSDRLRFGAVRDYIPYPGGIQGNLADIYLTVGVSLMLVWLWRQRYETNRTNL